METVGSLIDKISINELKIYHMTEQQERDDVSEDFKKECKGRLDILCEQRKDLLEEFDQLVQDVKTGQKKFKLYRQMKMYNEKKYKD